MLGSATVEHSTPVYNIHLHELNRKRGLSSSSSVPWEPRQDMASHIRFRRKRRLRHLSAEMLGEIFGAAFGVFDGIFGGMFEGMFGGMFGEKKLMECLVVC